MTVTRPQAEALATFVRLIRTDWDHPGIVAAIKSAANTARPVDVAHALLALADRPQLRTPAILPQPGAHWTRPGGEAIARRGDNDIPCPEHPDQTQPCPTCRAMDLDPDDPALTAAIAAARTAVIEAPRYVPRPRHQEAKP